MRSYCPSATSQQPRCCSTAPRMWKNWLTLSVSERPETELARVNAARDIQKQRFSGTNITCNAQMTPAMVGEFCTLDAAGEKLLKGAFERLGLTARSHDRLLRVARTIADLDGSEKIEAHHLAEAIQYRNTDILQG